MSLNLFAKILVASCASALAGLGGAAATGHVAPWWVAILLGVVGSAAGVVMQSPVDHQAIADRKEAASPPPATLLVLLLVLGLVLSACAHVATVASDCAGTVTADLRFNVASALDRDDYAQALEVAAVGILPCVFVSAVREVREASAQASGAGEPKAAMRLDLVVRVRRADTWLASHGGDSK